jgi:hypothetical protein
MIKLLLILEETKWRDIDVGEIENNDGHTKVDCEKGTSLED